MAKVLQIIREAKNTHLITCSATMDKKFIDFYKENSGDFETNKNTSHGEDNKRITLTGVNNYYAVVEGGEEELHKYVIKKIFKELYSSTDKLKPQVFVFFNSID